MSEYSRINEAQNSGNCSYNFPPLMTTESEAETVVTDEGVEYTPHSMMHKAIVQMDPMKLEMLDGFEQTDAGHKFTPEESNVRVIVTGRDWNEKRILVYGCTSTAQAEKHVETIIKCVTEVGHNAELTNGPEISNIAVSGDLDVPLQLDSLNTELTQRDIDVEYEPEQFPAAIVKLEEPPVTFLLFSTGKFVIQGLRGFTDIEPAIERVQSLIDYEP